MTRRRGARWVDYVSVPDLADLLRPDNPKGHAGQDIEDSFKRFGFVEPIVLDERTDLLVSGHGRAESLLKMLDEGADPPEGVLVTNGVWTVPVNRGWASADDTEAKAALIALNQITIKGDWIPDKLSLLLDELSQTTIGLVGVAFSEDDLDDLRARVEEAVATAEQAAGDGQGMRQDSTYDEFLERYEQRGIRSLVCDYPTPVFQWLIAALDDLREEGHSNAELIASLVGKAHGSEPPSVEPEPVEAPDG